MKIKIENPETKIKIVKAQWIFKCLTEGKNSDESEFIFERKEDVIIFSYC